MLSHRLIDVEAGCLTRAADVELQQRAPEALTSIHALGDGRLLGVATLASLLQAGPHAQLADVCDRDPVRASADTDVVDVAVLMSDYNLLLIPAETSAVT